MALHIVTTLLDKHMLAGVLETVLLVSAPNLSIDQIIGSRTALLHTRTLFKAGTTTITSRSGEIPPILLIYLVEIF